MSILEMWPVYLSKFLHKYSISVEEVRSEILCMLARKCVIWVKRKSSGLESWYFSGRNGFDRTPLWSQKSAIRRKPLLVHQVKTWGWRPGGKAGLSNNRGMRRLETVHCHQPFPKYLVKETRWGTAQYSRSILGSQPHQNDWSPYLDKEMIQKSSKVGGTAACENRSTGLIEGLGSI